MNKTLFDRVFKPTLIAALAGLFVIPTAVLATVSQASGAPKAAAQVVNSASTGGLIVATAENSIAPAPAPTQGQLVTSYKWIINVDPSGDPNQPYGDTICHPLTPTNPTGNANFPDTPPLNSLNGAQPADYAPCTWPSVHQLQSSQLISSGTDADWNASKPIPMQTVAGGRGLPDGNYLVSVLAAGYQLGGSHFQVVGGHIQGSPSLINPTGSPKTVASGFVAVNLNPFPIPLATARLKVYQDMASANSQWDEQTEPGIAGFNAQIADFDGGVTSDFYGHPLCTAYRTIGGVDANGQPVGLTELGVDGLPIVDPAHHWLGTAEVSGPSTGKCVSDSAGEISIPNLAPNRYGIQVIAPGNSTPPYTTHVDQVNNPGNGSTALFTDVSIQASDAGATVSGQGIPGNATVGSVTPGVSFVLLVNGVPTKPSNRRGGGFRAITSVTLSRLDDPGSYKLCPTQDTAPNTTYPALAAPCWVQTDTLEGAHDIDVWLMANDSGLDNEQVVGGEKVPWVRYGFVLAGCMQTSELNAQDGNTVGAGINPRYYNAPASCLVHRSDSSAANPGNGTTSVVTDTNITSTDAGAFVTGTNVPVGATVGAVTKGVSFVLNVNGNPVMPNLGAIHGVTITDPVKGVFPHTGNSTPTSTITGRVTGANAYIPGVGGLPGVTNGTNGVGGIKLEPQPSPDNCKTVPTANCQFLKHAFVALSDLGNNDKTEYAMPTDQYGNFTITGVPDGTYDLAMWDQPQNYIFDDFNVTVANGNVSVTNNHTVALGQMPLLPWFSRLFGHVFIDANGNGRQDPGEPGVPDLTLQNLNRTNNLYEQGQNLAGTDDHGYYEFTQAYPLGANNVLQFFFTRYKTTGVTFQQCNDPQEHTYITPAVDMSYLPIISQCARVDIGIKPYDRGDNGGIVATVFDQTVRAHYLGRQQLPYASDVGIPGIQTELFQAVKDPITGKFEKHCANADYLTSGVCQVGTVNGVNYDGSYVTTGLSGGYTAGDRAMGGNVYTTEHYGKAAPLATFDASSPNPSACVARDVNGNVTQGRLVVGGAHNGLVTVDGGTSTSSLNTPTFQDALPGLKADGTQACVEAPQTGQVLQFGSDNLPADATDAACVPVTDPTHPNIPATYSADCALHGVQTVDGNWGLAPTNMDGSPASGDYLTKVDIPGDTVLPQVDGADRPLWKVATEQDINNFGPAQGLGACSPTAEAGACAESIGKGNTPEFVPQGGIDWAHTYDHTGAVTHSASPSVFAWPPRSAPAKQMTPAEATPLADSPNTYLENPSTYATGPDVQCAGAQFTVTVAGDGTNIPGRDPNNADAKSIGTANGFLANGGSPVEGADRNLCDIHLIHVESGQSAAPNFNLYSDVPIPTMFQVQIFDDVSTSVDKRSTQYGEVAAVPNAPIGVYDYLGNLQTTINSDPNGISEVLMPSTDMTNCQNTPNAECSQVYRFVGNDPGTPDQPNANWNPKFSTIAAQFQAKPGVFEPADVAPSRAAAVTSPDAQWDVFTACQPTVSEPQFFSVNRPYTFLNRRTSTATDTLVINGSNFGTSPGKVTLTPSSGNGYDSTTTRITPHGANWWTPTKITVDLHILNSSNSHIPAGAYQLSITVPGTPATNTVPATPDTVVKALTYHVIDTSGYTPTVSEVGNGPGAPAWASSSQTPKTYQFTQDALEAAAGYQVQITGAAPNYTDVPHGSRQSRALVVVYPTTPTAFAPLSARYENIVLHSNVKVQGVGPGGFQPATLPGGPSVAVPGTVFDGRFFNSLFDHVIDGDPFVSLPPNADVSMTAEHALQLWYAVMGGAPLANDTFATDNGHVDPATGDPIGFLTGGQVVTVLGRQVGSSRNPTSIYSSGNPAGIDGIGITGGDAVNGPSNVNGFTGNRTGPAPAPNEEQGGAVYLNGHADYTQITNNAIYSNSGAYGSIRVGTPQMHAQHNHFVQIADNRIVANSGVNLAGAVGLFNDSSGYSITHNLICGNASAEYGGGISQNGFAGTRVSSGSKSTNGDGYTSGESPTVNTIADNKILLNNSYDEGGGITIAGELNAASNAASVGSGPVDILRNYISANLGNDDGGGIRFLMAGNFPIHVVNDMITNNVSTHEGGGIAIDDSPAVFIVNSTIAKNITTATAATSNGSPDPAGVSTADNSAALQATLPAGSPLFSNPLLFNDVFWDNRSGTWTPAGVTGIGLLGDTAPVNHWDVGVAGNTLESLSPTNSILQSTTGVTASVTNKVGSDPLFTSPWDIGISITPLRTSVRFRPSAVVSLGSNSLPANVVGDYTLRSGSPAVGSGATTKAVPSYQQPPTSYAAPSNDITGRTRTGALTIGAWQYTTLATPPIIVPAAVVGGGQLLAPSTTTAATCSLRLLLIALAQLSGRIPPPGQAACALGATQVRIP